MSFPYSNLLFKSLSTYVMTLLFLFNESFCYFISTLLVTLNCLLRIHVRIEGLAQWPLPYFCSLQRVCVPFPSDEEVLVSYLPLAISSSSPGLRFPCQCYLSLLSLLWCPLSALAGSSYTHVLSASTWLFLPFSNLLCPLLRCVQVLPIHHLVSLRVPCPLWRIREKEKKERLKSQIKGILYNRLLIRNDRRIHK